MLRVACGNRRASRCPACAWTYAGDTYHLIRAGITGDEQKDVPATVRDHPRVFATLTAPSFGAVHNRPDTGRCRCGASHAEDDAALGTALDQERYDYAGAAARASVPVPCSRDHPARTLRWGSQVDVQPIGALGHEELTEQAVASYVAKYATKAAETTGTVDHRIGELAELDRLPLPAHTQRLIEACWHLDDTYQERRLARWAHMLGFRGHFSTKSRRYSTTLGALRQVRADYRARQERRERGLSEDLDDTEGSTLVLAHWTYAGQGHTPGESWLAATIAKEIRLNRETAREEVHQEDEGVWQ